MVSKLNLYDKLKTKLINFIIIKVLPYKHYYKGIVINTSRCFDIMCFNSIEAIKYYKEWFNSLSIIDLIKGKVNNIPIYKYLINDFFKRKTVH